MVFFQLKIILQANSEDPDHSAASALALHCLHRSHKKDANLIFIEKQNEDIASNRITNK